MPTRPPDDSEQAFLARYDASRFPRPSVAVDVALVTAAAGRLEALLVRRDEHPFKDHFGLPGSFVGLDEALDEAAARVLGAIHADLAAVYLEQLYTFGAPRRDPRTRVISVAYYALVRPGALEAVRAAGNGTRLAPLRVPWAGETGGPVDALDANDRPLAIAFDHARMLGLVVQRLRGKLDYAPIGFELLPPAFTLRRLQAVHETIRGASLNKDSFRRRMLATGLVVPTGRKEAGVDHRPAALYRFARKAAESAR